MTEEMETDLSGLVEILEKKVQKLAQELVNLRTQYADLQSRFELLQQENKRAQKILAAQENSGQLNSQILNRLKKISEKLSAIN